jgi:hypothetical protein
MESLMIRANLKTTAVAAALSLSLAAAAYAQSFVFRTTVTGATGTPAVLVTLVNSTGIGFLLDADGAEPGTIVNGEIRTLTYRNQVSRDVQITGVTVSPSNANFVILSDGCTGTLVMGAQCPVQVQFRASEDGDYTATLNVIAQ